MFVDLGSGAGKLVAQARLELPPERLARAVGVELSPSRHNLASRGWASLSLADSGAPLVDGAGADSSGAAGIGHGFGALELRCESLPAAG